MHKFVLTFIFVCTTASLAFADADRVVLQINNTPYTQRQIEVYTLIKSCLQSAKPEDVVLVDAENWADKLEEFRVDMLVEQEAQRISSFIPSEAMKRKGDEVLQQKRSASAAINQAAQSFQLDERNSRRIVSTVLQIESLKRSKESQIAINSDEVEKNRQQSIGKDSSWIDDLASRSLVRYYKGAKNYVHIAFQ